MKTYASFGLRRSFRQLVHALRSQKDADHRVEVMLKNLRRDKERIALKLARPLRDLRILEVGPGQGMERARYFAMGNEVIGIDLDVIPRGIDPMGYLRILKKNSFGRFAKTLGRKIVLVDHANRVALEKALGTTNLGEPAFVHGDICGTVPEIGLFDLAVSWAVFEHLKDPARALDNIIHVLRPGGVLYIGLNLYTSNSGHHDIRTITGLEDPFPLWGHLRSSTSHLIQPSAYLNRWRLPQWRELFSEKAPGFEEFLETYGAEDYYEHLMTDDLRRELTDYTDDELLTVDAFYLWRKPNSLSN